MPIPSPRKGEDKDNFISRCMGNGVMLREYPKQNVRSGVCYNAWNTRNDAEQNPLQIAIATRKQLGIKPRRTRPPRWLFPASQEREYIRLLWSMVASMHKAVKETVVPRLQELSEQAAVYRPDSDVNLDEISWAQKAAAIVAQARISFKQPTRDQLRDQAEKVSRYNKRQLDKVLRSAVGADVFMAQPYLEQELDAFAEANVNLITSIEERYFTDIQQRVQAGIRSGQRHEQIAKDILARYDVTKSRAKLIARDQVSKLNGQLTNLRQKELGINKYRWRTSQDDRVRESHASKEGKVFSWDEPPSDTGHPGEDYQCRCTAEPVFDDLLG